MSPDIIEGPVLTEEQKIALEAAIRTFEKECFEAVQRDEEAKAKAKQSAYSTVIAAAKTKYELAISTVLAPK